MEENSAGLKRKIKTEKSSGKDSEANSSRESACENTEYRKYDEKSQSQGFNSMNDVNSTSYLANSSEFLQRKQEWFSGQGQDYVETSMALPNSELTSDRVAHEIAKYKKPFSAGGLFDSRYLGEVILGEAGGKQVCGTTFEDNKMGERISDVNDDLYKHLTDETSKFNILVDEVVDAIKRKRQLEESSSTETESDFIRYGTYEPKSRKYEKYLALGFTCVDVEGHERPQCLLCMAILAENSMKPSKLKRHLETIHPEYVDKSPAFFQSKLAGFSILRQTCVNTTPARGLPAVSRIAHGNSLISKINLMSAGVDTVGTIHGKSRANKSSSNQPPDMKDVCEQSADKHEASELSLQVGEANGIKRKSSNNEGTSEKDGEADWRNGSVCKKTRRRKYNEKYLSFGFTNTYVSGLERPQCVLCKAVLAANSMKPNKLKRHLEAVHPQFINKSLEFFQTRLEEFKAQLEKPHSSGEISVEPADLVEVMLGDEASDMNDSLPHEDIMQRVSDQNYDQCEQANLVADCLNPSTMKWHPEASQQEYVDKPPDFLLGKLEELNALRQGFEEMSTDASKAFIAAYKLAQRIAKSKKPQSIRESLVLPAAIDIVETMLGESSAKQLHHISLADDMVGKILDINSGLCEQLIDELRTSEMNLQADRETDLNKSTSENEQSSNVESETNSNKESPCKRKKLRRYHEKYLSQGFTFINVGELEKPQCVLCKVILSTDSMKPSKLRRHLEGLHPEHADKSTEFFQQKLEEFSVPRQIVKTTTVASKALLASYKISYRIARCMKPNVIGESLVLPAALDMIEVMFGESSAKQVRTIPIADNTVSKRILDIGDDLCDQMIDNLRSSNFSLQIDMATEEIKEPHLYVYVRYIAEGEIKEDLLFCKPVDRSATALEVFFIIDEFLNTHYINWDKCVGICTDRTWTMSEIEIGLPDLAREKAPQALWTHCMIHRRTLASTFLSEELKQVFQTIFNILNDIKTGPWKGTFYANLCDEMGLEHTTLLYYSESHWSPLASILQRVFELKDEIATFLRDYKYNGADVFHDESFVQRFAYLVDIFRELSDLNKSMQGPDVNILTQNDEVKAFQRKLELWEVNLGMGVFEMFPTLEEFLQSSEEMANSELYIEHLKELQRQFSFYFQHEDIDVSKLEWIGNPFNAETDNDTGLTSVEHKQLIDLSTDDLLGESFDSGSLSKFWLSVENKYPELSDRAMNALLPFVTSSISETGISAGGYMMAKYRCQIVNERELRVAISPLTPRFVKLCADKQAHISH